MSEFAHFSYGNYDIYGRPGFATRLESGGTNRVRLGYAYTDGPILSVRRELEIDGQSAGSEETFVDQLGRVERQVEVGPDNARRAEVTFDWTALDQPNQIVRYDGPVGGAIMVALTEYRYEPNASFLEEIAHVIDVGAVQTYQYTYDLRGRLKTFTTQEGTTSYTHDDFGQLTGADHQTQADESYGYDATGNRTNPGYQTGTPNLLWTDGRRWFDYDANGNRTAATDLLTGDVTRYHYDHIGRLIGVEAESAGGIALGAVGYDYDVFGRRISRVEWGASGAIIQDERWAHEGDNVLLKFGPTGAVLEQYLYGPAADQLLAVWRPEAGGVQGLWVLADHQQTVRDVIDSTGVLRKHWAFDSFGNVTATSGDPTLTFDHLYTGREYDATTGLYFYRARWYDPAVGRFISRDPQGLGDGPNPFAYVQNQAVSATDPSGEVAFLVLLPFLLGATVGAAHMGTMAAIRGDSLWWTTAQMGLGAAGGLINPYSAFASAGGAIGGAAIGYGIDGARGAYYGAEIGGLTGMLRGGFLDAGSKVSFFGKVPACAVTRPYLLPTLQAAGAGAGAAIGGLATGTLDGALAGANVGMLLGGIGATAYNLLRPCFAAGTPIRTAEGSKPIEEVVAGDYVLSRDENDPEGPVLLKVVEETFVRTGRIWVLRIDGREIRTTGEHPFYARGKGWTAAAELDTTDVLLSEDGRWLPIEALEDTGEYETVYNFRVADFHTYFIGGDGWAWSVWAHNACYILKYDDEGKAYLYLEGLASPIEFKNQKAAETWLKTTPHTPYVVPSTPPREYPNTRTISINKILPAPSVQRDGADAYKLLRQGFFSWDKYTPLLVYEKNGMYYFQNGMTRYANAQRLNITELPVQIVSGP